MYAHHCVEADLELLDEWRAGDRNAGDRLFERHFDSVFRFFDRKMDGDPADLVQRTFLACVESSERFEGRSSFRTFLFSIARHELYRHWRERKRRDDIDFGVSSVADLCPTPSSLVGHHRDGRLLVEALRRIPLDLQVAVELHYWEGLTGPEMAEVLEIPEPTIRSRLHRARETLAKKLDELTASKALLESTATDFEALMVSLRPS